jgi:hypothetical protein
LTTAKAVILIFMTFLESSILWLDYNTNMISKTIY